MSFDTQTLRGALGRYTTGVTITTCLAASGEPVGLTVNSFSSVSLDPPLVLWSLRAASPALAAFGQATHFAVNVLTEEQVELSRRFASPVHDRFAGTAWSAGLGGAPILPGCCAVFQCATERAVPLGDHVLYVGRVLALAQAPLRPLLFQGAHYHHLGRAV